MRNWQDMPASTNVQDMTYGPQKPTTAPWNYGPQQPVQPTAVQQLQRLSQIYGPHTPEQQAFLQSYMPQTLPTNPIAGSLPSGLTFVGNMPVAGVQPAQRWPGGPPTIGPGQPIQWNTPRRGPQLMGPLADPGNLYNAQNP